jgi:hypothetical protein
MIIKSMGRKASSKMSGTRNGKSSFANLVQYMTRGDEDEKCESVLWHGFYGHAGMTSAEIVSAFEENAKFLKERKNGNVLYHEILSFSRGYTLEGEKLDRAVTDIGQEYLRLRAEKQMAFGAIHKNTDHIHLHLMISANAIGRSQRMRLSKAEFAEIQKTTEAYTLTHYSELAQAPIYDRARSRERLKTQTHEQAMKLRTGELSRKESLKIKLHSLFEIATSREELTRLLQAEGMSFYTRGKSTGVLLRDADGKEYKHRMATLGISEHYQATVERLDTHETRENLKTAKQEKVNEEQPKKSAKSKDESGFGDPPENHIYTDDVLRKVQEKDFASKNTNTHKHENKGEQER